MISKISLVVAIAVAINEQAQAQAALTFEVASVRVAGQQPPRKPIRAAGEISGGPGTADPGRLTYEWCLMGTILRDLFGGVRISDDPDWLGMDRFDIIAKVPPGATKERSVEMMKNLLKERFHFEYHIGQKDFDAYRLVVAKGGAKLKPAAPAEDPPPQRPPIGTPAPPVVVDKDGFPVLPAGLTGNQGVQVNGVSRLTFRMTTPAQLAFRLSWDFVMQGIDAARIVDETGLTGAYDFKLEYSTARLSPDGNTSDPAPDMFTAVEKQLGLRLEKTKIPVDVLVIDHLDRKPTEN